MTKEEIFAKFEKIGVVLADQFKPKDEKRILDRILNDDNFNIVLETDPIQPFDFDTAEELDPSAIAYSEDGETWVWRPSPEFNPEAYYRFYYDISPELAWEWLQHNKSTPKLILP